MASVGQKVLKITGAVSQDLSAAQKQTARENAGNGYREITVATVSSAADAQALYDLIEDESVVPYINFHQSDTESNTDHKLLLVKKVTNTHNPYGLIYTFATLIQTYWISRTCTFSCSQGYSRSSITGATWGEISIINVSGSSGFDPAGTYPEMTAGKIKAYKSGEFYQAGVRNNYRLLYVSRDLSDDPSYEDGAVIQYTIRNRSSAISGLLYFHKITSYLALTNCLIEADDSELTGITFKMNEDESHVAEQGKKIYTIIAEVPANVYATFELALIGPGAFSASEVNSSNRSMGSEINANVVENKYFLAKQSTSGTQGSAMRPVYCNNGYIQPCNFAIKVDGVTSDTGVIFLV